MFSLEAALREILEFVLKFIGTFVISLTRPSHLIKKIKTTDVTQLIEDRIFAIISFFLCVPLLNSVFDTSNINYSNLLSDQFGGFYRNFSLLEKLLLVSPLILLSEFFFLIFCRLFVYDKYQRVEFKKIFRYFNSSLFLFSIVSLSLVTFLWDCLNSFALKMSYELKNVIDMSVAIALLFLLLIFIILLATSIYKTSRLKTTPWSFLLIPILSPLIIITLVFSFNKMYAYYNLRLNTAKPHLSAIDDINYIRLVVPRSIPNLYKVDSMLKPTDTVRAISTVLIRNNGFHESVIDLSDFKIYMCFYKNNSERYNKDDDGTSFELMPLYNDSTKEKYIIIKPTEAKVVEFETRLSYHQFKFIMHTSGYNRYNLQCYLGPHYDDYSNDVNEDVFLSMW